MNRRKFLTGLGALIAAPAIVLRAARAAHPASPYLRVDGAYQTGSQLIICPAPFSLDAGDIILIDGCEALNRTTNQLTGLPREFVITGPLMAGDRVISIYPYVIPAGQYTDRQFATVSRPPRNGAAIRRIDPARKVGMIIDGDGGFRPMPPPPELPADF